MTDEKTIGSRTLETIAELWQATGPRVRWATDGFAWWPGDFRVDVSIHKRIDGYIPETWMLTVRTNFLKDIPIDDPEFIKLAAAAAPFYAPTFAWVYPTAEVWAQYGQADTRPRLWLSSTAYITPDNVAWLPLFVGMMSILQPINAQVYHKDMPKVLGGGVPDKSRPEALVGLDVHTALLVAGQDFVPAGRETSRWTGTGEFQSIVEQTGTTEHSRGTADTDGLTIETSFGEDTAVMRLRTDVSHPALGTGLLATLEIPVVGEPKEIADECAGLNLIESMWTDDFPQLGCWHPRASREGPEWPIFTMFVPNALYRPGIAQFVAAWMNRRARWIRQQRYRSRTDKAIEAIMRKRFAAD